MTVTFAAFFIASFCAAVDPPVIPLKPERLAVLMKKLEVPTLPYENPRTCGMLCLDSDEKWALTRNANPNPLMQIYADHTKSSQSRAEAAVILTDMLRGYFRKPDESLVKFALSAFADPDLQVRQWMMIGYSSNGILSETWRAPLQLIYRWSFSDAATERFRVIVQRGLDDEDDDICASACRAMWVHRHSKIEIDGLLRALKRKNQEVRSEAIRALAMCGRDDPRSLPAMLKQLDTKNKDWPYYMAVYMIGQFGPDGHEAVPELIRLLERQDCDGSLSGVKNDATRTLGRIGYRAKKAVPAIIAFYKTGKGDSENTIRALMGIDGAAGMPFLLEWQKANRADRIDAGKP